MLVEPILRKWGLSDVPVAWYSPVALGTPSLMDTVPHPEYGNKLTVHEYQTAWLGTFHARPLAVEASQAAMEPYPPT